MQHRALVAVLFAAVAKAVTAKLTCSKGSAEFVTIWAFAAAIAVLKVARATAELAALSQSSAW